MGLASHRMDQWWGVKIADQALQVAKDQNRQQIVSRLIRKTQDGTLGKQTVEPGDEEGADMGVHVGDVIHQPPPPSPQTSPWVKAAVGAAIGFATAGPIGAALALPSIIEAFKSTPAPVVQPVTPATTKTPEFEDTLFELRLGPPTAPVNP